MITFNDHIAGLLIASAAGTHFNPACDVVIARERDNGVVWGGVVFQNYTGASIGLHCAGLADGWMNRDLLWAAFDYPFNQLHCKKIFCQISATNTKSLEFNRRIGFKEIVRIDDVFDDGPVVITSLGKDECRWHKIKPLGLRSGKEL